MSIHNTQSMEGNATANLFAQVEKWFTFANFRSFVGQAIHLRKIGFKMSSDYALVSSYFLSQIAKFENVKDCSCMKQDQAISLFAYLDKTDFETEEKIYTVHRQLLEDFPEINIDVRVVELCGRSKDELEALVR